MEDLIKIIKWRDEIREIDYTIDKLIEAEQNAAFILLKNLYKK